MDDAMLDARAALSRFTPERPMVVPVAMYALIVDEPALADLLDRVIPAPVIPSFSKHAFFATAR